MARRDQQQRRRQLQEGEEENRSKPTCASCSCDLCLCIAVFIFMPLCVVLIVIGAVYASSEPPEPDPPSMRVVGASASLFELDGDGDGDCATSTTTTLRYSLVLNASVCNEDKEKTYLVYQVVATALYGGVPLGYAAFLDPGQPLLLPNTDGCSIPTPAPPLRPALFRGETALPAGSQAAVLFRREAAEGDQFTIDVNLHMVRMESSDEGNPGYDGREFFKWMTQTVQSTSAKVRRPDQSSSSLRRSGGDDVVGRRL